MGPIRTGFQVDSQPKQRRINPLSELPRCPEPGALTTTTNRGCLQVEYSSTPIFAFFARAYPELVEGAGSDAAGATFVRSARTPLRMRSWYPGALSDFGGIQS